MNIFRKKAPQISKASKSDFVPSGSLNFDYLLGGGIPAGLVTQIYGSAGAGKSNICISTAVQAALSSGNVAFIDTESNFNKFRFEQLAGKNAAGLAKNNSIYHPKSLAEQRTAIEKLENFVDESFSLIIVDSFVALYRLELKGGRSEIIPFGRELGKQLSILAKIAREKKCAVVITNQVYDSFGGPDELGELVPSGGDALDYWSKIILWIERHGKDRVVTLVKHAFREDGESIKLRIANSKIE